MLLRCGMKQEQATRSLTQQQAASTPILSSFVLFILSLLGPSSPFLSLHCAINKWQGTSSLLTWERAGSGFGFKPLFSSNCDIKTGQGTSSVLKGERAAPRPCLQALLFLRSAACNRGKAIRPCSKGSGRRPGLAFKPLCFFELRH